MSPIQRSGLTLIAPSVCAPQDVRGFLSDRGCVNSDIKFKVSWSE
ncbi:hypothetical protein AVDCRST_MAG81-3351 [uncultured Synechococcales cyanobacterium]|uniref:Uncharacterized protein n=1 Tax=uncultured Synechococcales cyanobacterium TaxID=1936017 RepID=A0A6J4VS25_9CYAN|nr:hypothetical protein AVDCRST_MAG81-3351 [uncultured Synechococcales cyanobacterium]